jgi:hypothetical protein
MPIVNWNWQTPSFFPTCPMTFISILGHVLQLIPWDLFCVPEATQLAVSVFTNLPSVAFARVAIDTLCRLVFITSINTEPRGFALFLGWIHVEYWRTESTNGWGYALNGRCCLKCRFPLTGLAGSMTVALSERHIPPVISSYAYSRIRSFESTDVSETESVSGPSVDFAHLMRLSARDSFVESCHRESLKMTHTIITLVERLGSKLRCWWAFCKPWWSVPVPFRCKSRPKEE